jgi:hypothetical protein
MRSARLNKRPKIVEPMRPEEEEAAVLGRDEVLRVEYPAEDGRRDHPRGPEFAKPLSGLSQGLMIDALEAVHRAV